MESGITLRETAAREYLAAALGERAPRVLRAEGEIAESPLDGEGEVSIFAFDLVVGACEGAHPASGARPHRVVVGRTVPNYYPSFGLNLDDAYSLHVGTRFMLEMQIERVEPGEEPAGAREQVAGYVRGTNPRATLDDAQLAGLFRCDDKLFAVYKLIISGQPVYCMGADCPPGFYQLTQHPPQVALRLHLGKLIRFEARRPAREEEA